MIAYQGSKRRFAPAILDAMEARFGPATAWPAFYDLCAGSGQVALEVHRRAPETPLVLVDAGPWGYFWQAWHADPAGVTAAVQNLYGSKSVIETCALVNKTQQAAEPAVRAAQFLALLRGQYMGRLPTERDGVWSATCRKQGGGTAKFLLKRLSGLPRLQGIHGYAEDVTPLSGAVVYVDPGYYGLQSGHYNDTCDLGRVVTNAQEAEAQVAFSSDKAWPDIEGAFVTIVAKRCQSDVCRRELLIFPTH